MFKLNDKRSRDKFQRSERVIQWVLHVINIVVICMYVVSWVSVKDKAIHDTGLLIAFIHYLCEGLLMLLVGLTLLFLLRTKYYFVYQSQRNAILMFLITELSGLFFLSYGFALDYFFTRNITVAIINNTYQFSGLRTTI